MRHRNLLAEGIRALVANAQQVSSTQAVVDDLCKRVLGEVDKDFARGRRLDPKDMRRLYETLDAEIMKSLIVIDCRLRETLPTAARPKGAAIDVSYVGVRKRQESEGFDDLYELFTLRVSLKPKVATFHVHPHPIAFQYHAAERLVERVEGQSLPFELIGSELADWSLALWEAFRICDEEAFDMRLSLPCLDGKGILAGQFVRLPASPVISRTVNGTGRFRRSEGEGDHYSVFMVRTFIGSSTLRPEQIGSLNRLARWRLLNKAEYVAAKEASLWDVGMHKDGYDVPVLREETRAGLRAILKDRTFHEAMTTKRLAALSDLVNRPLPSGSASTSPGSHRGWIPPSRGPVIENRAN